MLRDYMTVLNILIQNPDATFDEVIGNTSATSCETEKEGEGAHTKKAGDFTANDIEF
jgi:hypothetical protein